MLSRRATQSTVGKEQLAQTAGERRFATQIPVAALPSMSQAGICCVMYAAAFTRKQGCVRTVSASLHPALSASIDSSAALLRHGHAAGAMSLPVSHVRAGRVLGRMRLPEAMKD
jgi:hypothetical protein